LILETSSLFGEVFMSTRRTQSIVALLSLCALAGCTTCRAPFDYAGPVLGPGGPPCNFLARRGSVFEPIGEIPPTVPNITKNATGTVQMTEPSADDELIVDEPMVPSDDTATSADELAEAPSEPLDHAPQISGDRNRFNLRR
jgi:hypothetical protein